MTFVDSLKHEIVDDLTVDYSYYSWVVYTARTIAENGDSEEAILGAVKQALIELHRDNVILIGDSFRDEEGFMDIAPWTVSEESLALRIQSCIDKYGMKGTPGDGFWVKSKRVSPGGEGPS